MAILTLVAIFVSQQQLTLKAIEFERRLLKDNRGEK